MRALRPKVDSGMTLRASSDSKSSGSVLTVQVCPPALTDR